MARLAGPTRGEGKGRSAAGRSRASARPPKDAARAPGKASTAEIVADALSLRDGARGVAKPVASGAALDRLQRLRARAAMRRGPTYKAGFAPGANGLKTPLGEVAAQYGFAEPAVLLHWAEIVGQRLATLCRPLRVQHGRGKDLARVLVVAAEGPAAVEIEYRADEIVSRVNAHYGYGAVTRIAITQAMGAAGGMAEAAAPFAHAPGAPRATRGEPAARRTPRPVARAEAERATAGIEDPGLRDALASFGAYVLGEPRSD